MNITVRKKGRRSGKASARGKAMRPSGHERLQLGALDVSQPTFNDDLTRIFKRNIAKARRENKKLLGSANGV